MMNKILFISLFLCHSTFPHQSISRVAKALLANPVARKSLASLCPTVQKVIQHACQVDFTDEAQELYNYVFDNTPLITTVDSIVRIESWNLEKIFLGGRGPQGGLTGFHHDYLGQKEEEYAMTTIHTCDTTGCYQAEWTHPDHHQRKTSTFFPKYLTRHEVLELLFHSMYENFPTIAAPTNRPDIFILNITADSPPIQIKAVIDAQECIIKTFYPNIVWPKNSA